MFKVKVFIVILTLFFIACNKKSFESSEELLEYLQQPENGYLYSKTINDVDFSILYKPTDLLVDQTLSRVVTKSKVDSLRTKYNEYLYFSLSMSKNNQELLSNVVGNKQRFGAMVNELAFGMEQKVHLYTKQKDTIAMADYIYPRVYGMSGATTILFVYPRDERLTNTEVMTLTIEDLGFYTGEVKFKIPTKIINNEPGIKF
ncbi:hypothetical protein [Aquimarina spongiae]|uniref:Uncharacterized protein n=1 Tax=Aquimarina spongiae TaxID=570521 RepID=A0A1M6LAU6_9FLAO|nr:hypothetical protein [Aquimarina spongiae]SHJ68308.1 hypothetical protein SAMN04488508_1153 [Aquimarina spongiae]